MNDGKGAVAHGSPAIAGGRGLKQRHAEPRDAARLQDRPPSMAGAD